MSAQKDNPNVWKEFVPVAMHVRKWDSGGYKDAYARPEFDEMLTAYQRYWKASDVYPPTVAANSIDWSGWSRGQSVPSDPLKTIGVLKVSSPKFSNKYSVEFAVKGPDASGPFTLHACLLSFGVSSRPVDGKNRGKALNHNFIVTLYRNQPITPNREGVYTGLVDVVPPKGIRRAHYGIAFWITKTGSPVSVQSTGGYLPE